MYMCLVLELNLNLIFQELHVMGFAIDQQLQSSLPVAGGHFVENWRVLTADQWVLNTVQGSLIPFWEELKQDPAPHPYQYPEDQLIQLQE